MPFTIEQYDEAIRALEDGKRQLAPDGGYCAVCGDGGHQAFECGRNPLVAMALCQRIARQSDELHTTLHYLAGYERDMGERVGPAKVKLPAGEA